MGCASDYGLSPTGRPRLILKICRLIATAPYIAHAANRKRRCVCRVPGLKLLVHPFDPWSARCGSHEGIGKVLGFPRNLVAPELHNAHGVGRLAVICQDEFGDPKLTAANDSSDSKPLFARLTGALVLYVASTAGSLA